MAVFRFKTFFLRALVTAASLCVVLILFEYYLRREVTYIVQDEVTKSGGLLEANPEFLVQQTSRGRRYVPNARVVIKNHFLSQQDIPLETNSLGFRGMQLAARKTPGELRLLFLGDSVTVADYLPQAQIFTELVGRDLSSAFPGRTVVSVNAGIGNIGLEEEVNILEDTIDSVRPDIVVVDFYLNDSRPPWGFSGEIGDRGWLRRHSILADTVYRQLEERRWMEKQGVDRFGWIESVEQLDWKNDPAELKKLAALARFDWGAAWDSTSWSKVELQLERLKRITAQAGVQVAIVAFPVSYQVEANFLDETPQRRLRQSAEKFGFAFYDLLPDLRAHHAQKIFYDHCHPNALGNEIIAKALSNFLRGLMLPTSLQAKSHSGA